MNLFLRFLALSLLITAAPAAERFGLEQHGRIVRLSDAQIAPDGRSVVGLVSRANFEENRYDVELVLVDAASRAQKVLTRRRASQPRWSPSGSSLAFLSPVDGQSRIFVIHIDGGEATQVFKAPMGAGSYAWRPDGGAFACLSEEEPAKREGEERHNRSFEADVNYLLTEKPRPHHLWLVPAGGGEAGMWSAYRPVWLSMPATSRRHLTARRDGLEPSSSADGARPPRTSRPRSSAAAEHPAPPCWVTGSHLAGGEPRSEVGARRRAAGAIPPAQSRTVTARRRAASIPTPRRRSGSPSDGGRS